MYNFKRCSPRGERQDSPRSRGHNPVISIHAPRVESDPSLRSWRRRRTDFNPRSPCGERPTPEPPGRLPPGDFNPRSPCGERPKPVELIHHDRNFNPRSPCGERLSHICEMWPTCTISIHAPRVGSDLLARRPASPLYYFNPRSPCGERLDAQQRQQLSDISIHAPRVGSDCGDDL